MKTSGLPGGGQDHADGAVGVRQPRRDLRRGLGRIRRFNEPRRGAFPVEQLVVRAGQEPFGELAQTLVEILQCPMGQPVGDIEVVALRRKVGHDRVNDLMLPAHPFQYILLHPGLAGEAMILILFVTGVAGEAALEAGQEHFRLFFNAIVHNVASFQSDFDEQGGRRT